MDMLVSVESILEARWWKLNAKVLSRLNFRMLWHILGRSSTLVRLASRLLPASNARINVLQLSAKICAITAVVCVLAAARTLLGHIAFVPDQLFELRAFHVLHFLITGLALASGWRWLSAGHGLD